MPNKVQLRRGTDAERGTVVLDSGEPGWTTDTKKLYVGDGVTYGGIVVTGSGGGTLCELSDVSCAGTVDGKALTYQSGTWVSRGTLVAGQIPGVDAAKITTGTFGLARIPTMDDAHIPDLETLSYGAAFATAQVPAIGAYKVTSGTLAVARYETLDNLNGTVALEQVPTMDDAHIPDLETLSYGAAFGTAQIPTIGAYKTTTGTFGAALIPSIDNEHLAGDITSDKIPALSGTAVAYPLNADTVGTTAIKASGVGNDELAASGLDISKFTIGTAGADRIPALPTARITTGTFNTDRVPDVGVVAINYVIDGGGAAITAGTVGFLEVPFACHANRWTLMADQHGSFVVDIWRDSYANFPPTDADSMPGTTNMPAICGTVTAQGNDLSGWGTQGIASGDLLVYHVDSCTSIELCTIALKVTKT